MKKKVSGKKIISLLFTFLLLLTSLVGCAESSTTTSTEADQNAETSVTEDADSTQEELTETTTESAEETSVTRTIQTMMGEIEVPTNPQRIVANWYVGYVISLDLNLVGYNAWADETMPFYDELAASTSITNWEPEDVLALDPDLIVTYKEEDFEKFSSVAPVLVISESESPLDILKTLGEATGKETEAEAVVAEFEEKLASAKETLSQDAFAGKTFSINQDWGSASYGVYYETGSRGGNLIYDYLGLEKPAKLEELISETGEGRGGLSYEVAADYFGDYILWFRPYDTEEDVPSEYENTEMWKTIPAVQEGNVVTIPGSMTGLFYYSDVVSLSAQLDYILDKLENLSK